MQVRAIERGYDNIKLREPGEVFEWPDRLPMPTWAQNVSEPFDREDEAERQRTATLAKGDAAIGLPVESPDPETLAEAQTRGRGRSRTEGRQG